MLVVRLGGLMDGGCRSGCAYAMAHALLWSMLSGACGLEQWLVAAY